MELPNLVLGIGESLKQESCNTYPSHMADFGDEYRKLSKQREELFAKTNYRFELRSDEDHKLIEEITAKLRQIREMYDSSHPMEGCPACGGVRKASLNGLCLNFKDCPLPKK